MSSRRFAAAVGTDPTLTDIRSIPRTGAVRGGRSNPLSAISTYTYDALNRVKTAAFKIGSTTDQAITYSYDSGTNGIGQLTSASDANHSMNWTYDGLGRVTNKSQTIGGVTKSVAYSYSDGNLTGLTTPSGQSVVYGYNSNHQVTTVSVNGTTVLSGVTYEPFGPVSGWTWGNFTTVSRSYDADGNISAVSSAGTKSYSYDDAFRITGISDTSPGAASWTYGHDALDRLTSAATSSEAHGWTYDGDGNRLTESGSAATTYTVSATSNRLSSTTGALALTYGYDAAGNVTSYSSVTATYNNRGRLATLSQGGSTVTYVYNALGERIKQSGGAASTVLYWYDEAGHLLGEYDGSGSLIEETIWLSDIPVATLRSGTPVGMFYVHTDHLNTPRQVTRPADNAQMWRWFSDPFGTNAPNENPAGAGPFAYNLRFPGQIFDGAAGLHYNYHRNYWPHLGRYVQPDPIGLEGGLNPYLYAGGNPLRFADPTGLQAWEPGLEPPSKIPGGPWTPAGPGQLPGDFYGPAQPSGPRDMCRYVPDAENGGPIDVPEAYWKTKIGGQRGWRQRYNLGGDPISAAEAHRGNPPLEPLPPSVPPAVPWAFFLWALFHSEPAY